MNNPTDTNQASEDELREQLADKLEWYSRYRERGQDDDMDRAFDGILALIRTEKLKLLAKVREQTTIFKIKAHDKKGQPHLYEAGRGVPTEVVDKLEAEL